MSSLTFSLSLYQWDSSTPLPWNWLLYMTFSLPSYLTEIKQNESALLVLKASIIPLNILCASFQNYLMNIIKNIIKIVFRQKLMTSDDTTFQMNLSLEDKGDCWKHFGRPTTSSVIYIYKCKNCSHLTYLNSFPFFHKYHAWYNRHVRPS